MRHDKLADKWRENDQTHGDQAKPCGRESAGARIHVSLGEVLRSVALRKTCFYELSIGRITLERDQVRSCTAAKTCWRAVTAGGVAAAGRYVKRVLRTLPGSCRAAAGRLRSHRVSRTQIAELAG